MAYKYEQVFHFVTMHAFDRRIDRQTEFSSPDGVCIPCSAVKMALGDFAHPPDTLTGNEKSEF